MNKKSIFYPGDEWIYIKIYCGIHISDKIISSIIAPLAEQMLKNKLIIKWFFLRYRDNENHLRIRFLCTDLSYFLPIIRTINTGLAPLQDEKLIWKTEISTYNRETSRYLPNQYSITEDLFCADSQAISSAIATILLMKDENSRWEFALMGIDKMMDDFNCSILHKHKIMKKLAEGYGIEFHKDKMLRDQLATNARKYRKEVADILQPQHDTSSHRKFTSILTKRSKQIVKNADKLLTSDDDEKNYDLISSYLHMFCNRLFRSQQRIHELVLYDLLNRHYQSSIQKSLNTPKAV